MKKIMKNIKRQPREWQKTITNHIGKNLSK